MTRVKVCGVTTVNEAHEAVAAGADAIGLVFYPSSCRFVSVDRAAEIVRSLPPFVTAVGLFVDIDEAGIQHILDRVPLGLLQFHGHETDQQCRRWRKPYIKALRIRQDSSVEMLVADYPGACGHLLDAYQKGAPGGTGECFDWQLIPASLVACLEKPIILAGGLNSQNVSDAIKQVAPYAVDVSSGVECAPGQKDPAKIRAFIRSVKYGGS